MYKQVVQKPAHFLFTQMAIVLGIHNFGQHLFSSFTRAKLLLLHCTERAKMMPNILSSSVLSYNSVYYTKGPILYLVLCHCHSHSHSHNAYQQCLPSSSVQSYRINIAKALWLWIWLWLWQEKQDTCPLLKSIERSAILFSEIKFRDISDLVAILILMQYIYFPWFFFLP